MIAKIIVAGESREAARTLLVRALAETAVLGVATNLGFLARLAADPEFAAGRVDTGFIERRRDALLGAAAPLPDIVLAAAALDRLLARRGAVPTPDPWSRSDGWRLNLAPAAQSFHFCHDGTEHVLSAVASGDGWRLTLPDREHAVGAEYFADGGIAVRLDGVQHRLRVLAQGSRLAVFIGGESWVLDIVDPLAVPAAAGMSAGRLTSPMPGRVVQLLVRPGDAVRQGQAMLVVEAMKMEHTIAAPRDGTVAAVHYAPGDLVEEGAELISLAAPDDNAG
jgi:3-methylcrotonyl-CoA carboxylase alpha subunit